MLKSHCYCIQSSEPPPKQISQHFHRHKATSSSSYHCKLLLGSATEVTTPKRVHLEPPSPNEESHGNELCPPSAQSTHCTIIHLIIEMMELLWPSVALYPLPNSSLQRIPTQHQQTPTLKTDPSGKPSVSSRQLYRVPQTETTLCSPPTPYNQRASLTNR